MFKGGAKDGAGAGDTIIAAGVKVEGDFTSEGNILIEGEVVGGLRTAMDLQVGEHARISADVTAGSARVAGEIRGNVTVRDRLELTATARIAGDVHAKVLIVEAGAQMNGRVLMGSEVPVKAKEEQKVATGGLGALVGGRAPRPEKLGA